MEMKKLIIFLFFIPLLLFPQTKRPNVAGMFYPADKNYLSRMVEGFLEKAEFPPIEGEILGLIAPHAGYVYSGPVAGYSFRAVQGRSYSTVIILAPSHHFYFRRVAIYPQGTFLTPLRSLEVDKSFCDALLSETKNITPRPEVFEREHAIEVELPFLIKSLKGEFRIVPILFSQSDYSLCEDVGKAIARTIKKFPEKKFLILASTDLSHYHSYEEAQAIDRRTIEEIKKFSPKSLLEKGLKGECELCGLPAVVTMMIATKELGANEIKILKYLNSGDTQGMRDKVVGYLAAVVVKKGSLSREEKEFLLKLARESIKSFFESGKLSIPEIVKYPRLKKPGACFVTLKENGRLRGCIGTLFPGKPLYENVARMAVSAAFYDYRFPPLRKEELEKIKIEISVLSPLKRIKSFEEIEVGKHGLYLVKGSYRGVLLPQVATEYGWDRWQFLQAVSRKAGLPPDAYKEGAVIYIFTAEVFGEEE